MGAAPGWAYLPFRGVSYSGFIDLPESQSLSPVGPVNRNGMEKE